MPEYTHHVAILGAGTIGLSMVALHLRRPDTRVTIYDPRPDFDSQLHSQLPAFLDPTTTGVDSSEDPITHLISTSRLAIAPTLAAAVEKATIIQEQSPEKTDSKQALWTEVVQYADANAHLWSSSSGILPSAQAEKCPSGVAERLLVAHPFNPPHIMPLVEIVPSPVTRSERVDFVKTYFETTPGPSRTLPGSTSAAAAVSSELEREEMKGDPGQFVQHYRPVILRKEIPGFVGNRLAFALLREASYLVGEGVVSARDLDSIVTASLGPRWAGSGIFESYHAGGGEGGIGAFLQKLAPTVQDVWGQLGQVDILTEAERQRAGFDGDVLEKEEKLKWRAEVVRQTEEAYGPSTTAETRAKKEAILRNVLALQKEC
ncbi:hypothetical protein N7509_007297 [Penicillium cosmopolitanum]|uniref:L-gulonate 3-dehydrogenase n=1 Tax=Penicillium cosmopolitanum TaxID=1131564 RepID=A0A9X0B888_9EURO|nr:uncharacterized protein N7509_007297 [Penicillium cosmopolitanum]KAJ5391807.1 hypothetical protein N7509_007297 [Penicillium cosmopolitanum]